MIWNVLKIVIRPENQKLLFSSDYKYPPKKKKKNLEETFFLDQNVSERKMSPKKLNLFLLFVVNGFLLFFIFSYYSILRFFLSLCSLQWTLTYHDVIFHFFLNNQKFCLYIIQRLKKTQKIGVFIMLPTTIDKVKTKHFDFGIM